MPNFAAIIVGVLTLTLPFSSLAGHTSPSYADRNREELRIEHSKGPNGADYIRFSFCEGGDSCKPIGRTEGYSKDDLEWIKSNSRTEQNQSEAKNRMISAVMFMTGAIGSWAFPSTSWKIVAAVVAGAGALSVVSSIHGGKAKKPEEVALLESIIAKKFNGLFPKRAALELHRLLEHYDSSLPPVAPQPEHALVPEVIPSMETPIEATTKTESTPAI